MIKSNLLRFSCALVAAAAININADTLELAWQLQPGGTVERPLTWLTTGNTERGLAFNPVTKHLLVVSRAGGLNVRILDAATGADITVEGDPSTPKTLDVTGISGGTFAASMIGVTEDGVIYAANLTTGSLGTPFKVYRWANEDATPTVAYSGDPGGGDGAADRWGDSFDVRGSGLNTQFLAGTSDASPKMAVFTTTDGENFTHTTITGAANTAGSISVAFGAGNTGWTKRPGSSTPLRQFSFDLGTGAGTFLRSFDITPVASIGFSGKYFGGVAIETPDNARVYDVSDLSSAPIEVGRINFPTDNANGNAVGSVDFGDGLVFFLDTNNGIVAARIIESITPVSITTHPPSLNAIESGNVKITVAAAGTPPIQYQWMHAGTNLPGATSSTLLLTNVNADSAGEYTVEVKNSANTVVSNPGILTITPIVRGSHLTLKWKANAGTRSFLTDDGTARGLAYNPATGHLLVISRAGGIAIHVLDAQTGQPVMVGDQPMTLNLDPSIVTGASPAEFRVNMIGIAADGAIYAANLTTASGSSAFKVYRWDTEDGVPYPVYAGDPSAAQVDPAPDKRFGDTFDVRGSGENTEILVGCRGNVPALAGNIAVLIKPNGADPFSATATVIHVPDAPNAAFGLGICFGDDNSFLGTAPGQPVRLVTYTLPTDGSLTTTGTVTRNYTAAEIPTSSANVGYDTTNDFLAVIAIELPDNVRLYKVGAEAAGNLVDQELFEVDAANVNGTGSLDFGGNMLFALDTNNGIMAFDVSTTTAPTGATLAGVSRAANGTVTLSVSGTVGAVYTVEVTNDLNGTPQWTKVTDQTIGATGTETVTDANAAGQGMRFYRAVAR